MHSKAERHRFILRLVRQKAIRTQRELQESLQKEGLEVNQATLSRDIQELGLFKTSVAGTTRYASPDLLSAGNSTTTTTTNSDASARELSRFVRSILASQNILVVQTDSGAANHVAEAIDSLGWQEIIGTIAGDNTIMLVVKEGVEAGSTRNRLTKLFEL
ncbi:MAG: arginine repressor [Candidatus Melainabacteria bacterium]|nr:arginine repressor [Candidatus Melainabacteria bacterium]